MCPNRELRLSLATHPRACDVQRRGQHTAPTLLRCTDSIHERPSLGRPRGSCQQPRLPRRQLCRGTASWLHIQSLLQLPTSLTSPVNLAQNTSPDKHKPFPTSPWLPVNSAHSDSQQKV